MEGEACDQHAQLEGCNTLGSAYQAARQLRRELLGKRLPVKVAVSSCPYRFTKFTAPYKQFWEFESIQ
jgi:hypothetical protein